MSILFHFLDNNHRLGFILKGISYDGDGVWSVRVKYKIRTSLDDINKKEEDFIKPVIHEYEEDEEDEEDEDDDLPIAYEEEDDEDDEDDDLPTAVNPWSFDR